MSYRFVDSFRAGPGWNCVPSWSCSKAVYKPVWHTTLLSLQWMNSSWWTDELSETCRVSCQNKFVKLVRLVGFIIKTWRFYVCNTAADITKCCLDKVLTHKRKIIVTATLSIWQLYKETQESHINNVEGKGIVSSDQRIQSTVRSNDNPEPRSCHLTSYIFFRENIREILSAEVQ